jgi:hypothetical protein
MPETKRIDRLPRAVLERSMTAALLRPAFSLSPKHDMLPEWMPFIIAAGAQTAWQALQKMRNLAAGPTIIARYTL